MQPWYLEGNMKRLLILVALFGTLAVGFHPQPAQSADASAAWNQVAASYNFNTTFGGMMNSTFEQNYRGADFSSDFAAILSAVSHAMGTEPPPLGGGDLMHASLANWPDT
jgi:hypothetical protein